MATEELQSLRLRYKAAYTRYLGCVRAIADASQTATWPQSSVLEAERETFEELCTARQLLFAALRRQASKSAS